jgi:hypothetical protein
MATKPSVVFKTQTLSERKYRENHDSPCVVNPGKAFVYSTYNPATGVLSDYTFPVHKSVVTTLTGSGTITTPTGYSFTLVEARVRIINPATASATGVITINASNVTGATAIPLDAAVGTIRHIVPTGANTGTTGQAIAFAVSGDTNGTFKGEVEVVFRPTGQFSTAL